MAELFKLSKELELKNLFNRSINILFAVDIRLWAFIDLGSVTKALR